MSKGKHENPSVNRESKRVSRNVVTERHSAARGSKRSIALIVALVLAITGVIGGTVAYLVAEANSVSNAFLPTQVSCAVQSNYQIQNTSDIDAYIRATATANFVNADGNICAECGSATAPTGGTNWTVGSDGYYYYDIIVPENGLTEALTMPSGTPTEGHSCTLKIEVFASAIQSVPDTAVNQAWPAKP